MVDHNDETGSSAPQPAHEGGSGGPTPGAPGSPEAHETHPAAFKHPHPAASRPDDPPRHPVFPMVLGAVMLIVLVVAWGFNMKPTESATASSPGGTATEAAGAPAATPAEANPTAELGDGLKALKSDVDGLKGDLKSLQQRLDDISKAAAPPDLEQLNSKIAALAKSTEGLADVPKKVDDLNQRIGSLDTTLASLRGDVDTLKNDVKTAASTGSETPKPSGDSNVTLAVLDQGADLFKAGKYKEASDAFRKLTESNPGDARVWYYAAISRGSATKDWTGETLRMVEKGVELEKAGSPDSAKIDSALADLNPTFKNWLDAYRKAARTR
jgi:TolA-binding protein